MLSLKFSYMTSGEKHMIMGATRDQLSSIRCSLIDDRITNGLWTLGFENEMDALIKARDRPEPIKIKKPRRKFDTQDKS